MNKLYPILILVFILLASSAYAEIPNTDDDLMFYWKFDDTSSPITDLKDNKHPDVTLSCQGVDFQLPAVDPHTLYSINFTDSSTSKCYNVTGFDTLWNTTDQNNWTVIGWWNHPTDTSDSTMISTGTSADMSFSLTQSPDPASTFRIDIGPSIILATVAQSFYNKAVMFIGRANSTAYALLNGTETLGINGDTSSIAFSGLGITIGSLTDGIGHVEKGTFFSMLAIFNRSLTTDEIADIILNGITEAAVTATSIPTIVAPSPVDNSHNNTNVTLNVTHDTLNNDVNYYLYFGDTTPLSETDLYQNNVSRTGDEYASFVTNVSDGTYYWKWRVQNTTSGTFSGNTTQRTLIIDTVNPTITILPNTTFSTDNSTIISNFIANLSVNISFFDINLAGGQTLINITNETDNSVFQILNTSITGTTVNISQIIDLSNWSVGNYTIKLIATDSHTASTIEKYDVVNGLNYFRYETKEGNTIKITSDTLPLTKKTTKLTDRYDFEFNYLFQKNTYIFRLESYNKIKYIQDSEYNAHFVIIGENGEGNWIDFDNPNLAAKDYTITKIDDYNYEVEIKANGIKNFKFKSLGGLNRVEQNYLLRIGAVIDIWVFDEEERGKGLNATATIGSQAAHTKGNTSPARLYNITQEITFVTLNASGYGIEEKSISITKSFHNFSLNMTVVNAVQLSFFDEKSGALIEGETFSVFLEKTGFSQIFSGITNNPHSITELDSGSYKLKASSTNYPERQYLDLSIINTTTTLLNIYLINSTLGDEKTFSIRDVGINPLQDVRVTFLRTINGIPTVIVQENSDFAGQVKLTLDPNNLYTINFSKSGFRPRTINLEPVDDVYTITLTSTTDVTTNQSIGIVYKFRPIETVLNNNTNINFTFTLNSSFWTVTNCTLRLKNGTILLSETSSFTSNSCDITIEQNTLSMTNITSEAIYELDSSQTITVQKQYRVIYTYEGDFSLKNFLDDLSDLSDAGFDNFTRFIIGLIVIIVIVSLVAKEVNFTNPDVLIILTWALVGFFSFLGWFRLDYQNIPDIFGLRQYIVFVLVSLISLAFFIDKFTR